MRMKGWLRSHWIALAIAVVSAPLCFLAVAFAWRPTHLVWARNGYAMAQDGTWTGLEAFGAFLAYWFYALYGEVVLTGLVALLWMGFVAWKLVPQERGARPGIGDANG